ncbi:uncharacterized protein BX663DRAFT_534722 [Cokeromyces recurvatus]|uniref:uncharacterized protein n=1 Tax=Cokeromyces recurvatus TaxID=90255 RepID=UPI00221E9159|nr:uncharacterized protein BX663DRAFT_534722 [Cokeromyces recurvatus]KAI7906583.1 hypothetical protein BX663DRAFT_534722 [Cokeromyces recurvatus]
MIKSISSLLDEESNERIHNKKNYSWYDKDPGESTPLLNITTQKSSKKKALQIIATIAICVFIIVLGTQFVYNPFKKKSEKLPQLTDAEKFILEFPSNTSIRNYLKTYTSEAHLAGTTNDKRQAEWTHAQFQSFGLQSEIVTYWPLLNYPIERRLALISGPPEFRFEAKLREDVIEEDETSQDPNVIPTFHGYSKNGTVRGPVIYANYGRLQDFQFLKDQGIPLNGTIALVRYGGSFRGLKVRAAEVFGCAGVLIYSDPIDDGPVDKKNGESYPNGPWRSPSSVQRGSVQYISLITGDPLTPGYAATENATRIQPEDSPGLAKIPSLPLSWEDALPLLKATQGRGIRGGSDDDWSGGLKGVDYFSGPTEGEVIMINHIKNKITPIWNVVARIDGCEEGNRAVILGNHRDAWVYGAVDPSSGSASLLELARGFGQLLKIGWCPRRTILLASWDAEEYGLVGSTEWVEDNQEWLKQEAVTYINVDTAVSGSHFKVAASPSLKRLLYTMTKYVKDPNSSKSVFDVWSTENTLPHIGELGSGSDFVGFLDHLGIASISMAFKGAYGVYHSNYDSFHWMEKFGDPQFLYHETLVKVWGLIALRLADSPLLPIHPIDYAQKLNEYVKTLTRYAKHQYKFSKLEASIRELSKQADRFERYLNDQTNDKLTYFERNFIDEEGIKGREWFKHVVYAPGLWTGYSSQVFPAIVEAIDAKDKDQIKYTEERAVLAIQQATKSLQQ